MDPCTGYVGFSRNKSVLKVLSLQQLLRVLDGQFLIVMMLVYLHRLSAKGSAHFRSQPFTVEEHGKKKKKLQFKTSKGE